MRARAGVMLVLSLPCAALGAFMGIIDPRHGSEVVGYPLMLLGALLLLGGLRAFKRPPT